jgi:hypothetical protein
MLRLLYFVLSLFVYKAESHGRLTNPIPRLKMVDGGLNAPIYTCLGPAFQTSATSMRCHDSPASVVQTTYNSGDTINLEWVMEAPHPGDCSIWLSYDTNVNSPQNWIKLKDIPGCLSPNGIATPSGRNFYSFVLPSYLPSCEHCVLRWEWYAVQQVSNVEFYVNCADVKIVNNLNNNCDKPGPTTSINGIEHLLYNLEDPQQKGCPFYNVYDSNFRPPLNKRSRGPKEWVPQCNNGGPIVPTIPQPPVIVYPCANKNCGTFGTCNNGLCICKNGYSGNNCEIPPPVQCNINCNVLNRNTCITDNTCGKCKNGFTGLDTGNNLCKISCNNDCVRLNRRGCTEPNVCGVCLPGFTEPNFKNRKESCLKTAGNADNGISLSISAQWDSGFCGRWITKCPLNREISFIVPEGIREVRGWNLANMQKINNKIIGNCAEWVQTGGSSYGGFCGTFNYGQQVFADVNGFYFTNGNKRLLRSLEDYENIYKNVSIVMNIDQKKDLNYETIVNDMSMNVYGSDVVVLDNNMNNDKTELSLKVLCNSRMEFDGALFLHLHNIDSSPIDENMFFKEPIVTEEGEGETNSVGKNQPNLLLILLSMYIIFI